MSDDWKTRPVDLSDPDNPEWTDGDVARAVPVEDLPEDVKAALPQFRAQRDASEKVRVTIRLSPEVVDHFKAGGEGWQGRIDEALMALVKG